MPDLPTGTVTFLFTDIEESTQLLQELGADRYRDALESHRRLLRDVVARHGGYEVDTQGDAFFVAFRRAQDAVRAAVEAQRTFAGHAWPDGRELRVRMGIHTCEATATSEGYVGVGVHRGARICAAGHGSQVLLSHTTCGLIEEEDTGFELIDLGEHRLKDLSEPHRLFQLLHAELPRDFPPLKTLGNRLTNLPTQVTRLVGREREIAEITGLLGRDGVRLLTLTGPGGTGKTRLAIEAATRLLPRFGDGAWLAELAPVTLADGVPHVIADVIGAVQQPGKAIIESVVDSLRHRSVLLVLDNCEHVLDVAADLASAVTTQCPAARILVTSRESLAIPGERVLRLQSLSDTEGAELFRDRARGAGSESEMDPETLARLSARLDGIALAIELAAARCASLSPEEIEKRLDDRFRLLQGSRRGRVERHQTLRNAVAWSYDLLEDLEQSVFDRLSAFAGGFTLEAAKEVTSGDDMDALDVEDAIAALVDRSMVVTSDTEDGTRYRLLETLRQFGEEQLIASGEGGKVQDRHVQWFASFMRDAWTGFWSPDDAPWIRAIGHEFENLRAAVHTAIDNEDRDAVGALLKPLYWWAWQSQRYEAGDWAEVALALTPEPPYARAVAVNLRAFGGRIDDATRLASGMDRSENSDLDEVCLQACARLGVASVLGSADIDDVIQRAAESVARTGNQAWATALKSIEVTFAVMVGRMDEAKRIAAEALAAAEETGNTTALSWAYLAMGRAYSDSDPELATRNFDRSYELTERHRLPLLGAMGAALAATVIARVEEPGRGRVQLSRALRSFIVSGNLAQLWTGAHNLAFFLIRAGHMDDAMAIWEGLGSRPAYAAKHLRDELTELLGDPGENQLSDDELIERIRGVLHDLERDDLESTAQGA